MKKPLIMGIVNVTPDSFSDGGSFFDPEKAIEHGLKLIKDGADVLDIGGESTRPGAVPMSHEEEIKRVIPVINELVKSAIKISIDTRHAKVMQAALAAGASFINDISAFQEQGSLEIAVHKNVQICLMHMQGQPKNMQQNPAYKNVIDEVFNFLEARLDACLSSGIDKEKIYIDVGIGFGKTVEHNLELLKNLKKFRTLGVKILLGTSRKKFIETVSGQANPTERLGGSVATALWAFQHIDIIRVHDVFETRQAFDVWSALGGMK